MGREVLIDVLHKVSVNPTLFLWRLFRELSLKEFELRRHLMRFGASAKAYFPTGSGRPSFDRSCVDYPLGRLRTAVFDGCMTAFTFYFSEADSPQTALNVHVFLKANGGLRRTRMGIAQYDPAALGQPAWNAGRQVGVKKPLKQRQIWTIRFFLDREGRMRDRALFDLAIDSRLRGCDLVKIKKQLSAV